eukprot:3845625-Prymnesium_polylepis.1
MAAARKHRRATVFSYAQLAVRLAARCEQLSADALAWLLPELEQVVTEEIANRDSFRAAGGSLQPPTGPAAEEEHRVCSVCKDWLYLSGAGSGSHGAAAQHCCIKHSAVMRGGSFVGGEWRQTRDVPTGAFVGWCRFTDAELRALVGKVSRRLASLPPTAPVRPAHPAAAQ